MQLTVYLCGPITGMPNLNREAFEAAEAALLAKGYHVTNPHKIPEHVGATDQSWQGYMKRDLPYLLKADLVALLDGWIDSAGASYEMGVCQDLHIHLFHLDIILEGTKKSLQIIMNAIAQNWEVENRKVPGFSVPE